jgi:hypothetical protein
MIGMARENPAVLAAAVEYLAKHASLSGDLNS